MSTGTCAEGITTVSLPIHVHAVNKREREREACSEGEEKIAGLQRSTAVAGSFWTGTGGVVRVAGPQGKNKDHTRAMQGVDKRIGDV